MGRRLGGGGCKMLHVKWLKKIPTNVFNLPPLFSHPLSPSLTQDLVELFNFHNYDNLRHFAKKYDPRREGGEQRVRTRGAASCRADGAHAYTSILLRNRWC